MSSKKVGEDLSITVMTFYMKVVGFWIASNCVEERRRNLTISYTFFAVFFAMATEARDLYFTWGNFSDSILIICNLVTVILVLFKISISLMYKNKLLKIIQYAKTNFWNFKYDLKHEQIIINTCKRYSTFFVCIFTFFSQGTVISFVIKALKENVGKNETERIHPFNLWLNESWYMTPYFEMVFIIEVLSLYHVGVCYLYFDNFMCIINLHIAGQFRILQHRFSNVCNEICEKCYQLSVKSPYSICKYAKLKTYIRQHQTLIEYCRKLEIVSNFIIFGQVLLFSLLICLDGYLILMEDTSLMSRLIFTFHLISCMCQLLMFTYSCDCLIRDSTNIANATYNSLWSFMPMDKYGKMLRKDLILVIMRSKSPCYLTALGFFPVSLETYISNFWHLDYDRQERLLFTKCSKFCTLWTITVFSFTQASLTFYIITPICANIGKNKSERILPFKMWIDFPLSETPYYEIMFLIQLLTVQQIGIAYTCNDNFLCVLNMHVVCQFRILQHRLSKLWSIIDERADKINYASKCYEALKECIRHHQSLIEFCDKLEYVYTLPIFAHVVVFSLLMCFDTYEIFLANVPISMRLIFFFHMVGSFIHIIVLTYICGGLIEESSNIGLATYSGWWTVLPMDEAGRMLREDVKVMIMKSMRPCYLSAGGFFPVSLETSTALMSSTLSYFTLMRESSKDK